MLRSGGVLDPHDPHRAHGFDGQDLVRDRDLAAEAKFIGLCVVIAALLLVSYQLFVRYPPIGWLLNGRRKATHFVRRPSGPEPAAAN